MKYIVTFDNTNYSSQMLNDNYEGDDLTFDYFESINFYRPIKTYFEDNLTILAVNSFIISSDFDLDKLLTTIKEIITPRGNLHRRPLTCKIHLYKIVD